MNKLITLLVIIFYTATIHAQKLIVRKNYISVSSGFTNSIVYGSMQERNNTDHAEMRNRRGFLLSVLFEKPINQTYLKYGIAFIKKQVNPMEKTLWTYKDELKTLYLSIPFLVGFKLLPVAEKTNVQLEVGPVANIKLKDNSLIGPDRSSHKVPFIALSACGGISCSRELCPNLKLLLQYRYLYDVTNSYIEGVYWTPQEPDKKFIYKYKTHSLALGLQWAIK
jgi:hypothetical protein